MNTPEVVEASLLGADTEVQIAAALLSAAFLTLTVWLFKAFTPEPEPFIVEYVSPKIDPPELRNL